MDEKLDVTALILAKNEAREIGGCIESARLCREILVLDSGSTDGTREIARALGAKVIETDWPGDFSVQRNRADGFATTGWVFHLDADERISEELADELRRFFRSGLQEKYSAARMPRKEILFGRWIRHGGWYPQYKLRLYRREAGRWSGRVHERCETAGDLSTFAHPIVHDSYRSVHVFLEKFNRYSTIDAEEEFTRGGRFSLLRLFLVPAERFFGRYVRHQGFRDGLHGFVLASLIALNYFLRYLKLWEMQDRAAREARAGRPDGDDG